MLGSATILILLRLGTICHHTILLVSENDRC